MSTADLQAQRDQVRATLEEELRRVRTPEDADRIVAELERLAAGTTEQAQGQAAERNPAPAGAEVVRTAQIAAESGAPRQQEAAAVLTEAAQQSSAQTAEGEAAVKGAQAALAPSRPGQPVSPPETERGAELLKEAVLRHLGPLQALDARIFLAINRAPHPAWTDRLADLVSVWTVGGWVWAGGVLVAKLLGARGASRALVFILPSMMGATFVVEYPVKAFFRRQRPFIDVVRALVVGKKPGSWSFPSGHTTASFACAWVLSTVWPSRAPLFFALAGTVGFSRIYVGAHYPGDVTSGAFAGMVLAELFRRGTRLVMHRLGHTWI
jgi:membrane-associated phospholipid phosphatase